MSQLEKKIVGCKLLHTWQYQYLWDMNVHYDYVHWSYNSMYIEVRRSKQRNFGHKITTPHWSMRDQRVEKMNNWSVESWIIEVNPQLYAVTESYKAVETILEQLRPLLIHAKRKEDLSQKIISNPHNFDSQLDLMILAWIIHCYIIFHM